MKHKGRSLYEWILKPSFLSLPGLSEQKWIQYFPWLVFFLGLHLVITRFPLIYPDSARYLGMAVFGRPDLLAPTFVSWMLGPLCHWIGTWAFAVFQIILLSYTSAIFLDYFQAPLFLGIAAILCSAAGFMAVAVMMDIYTAIGLISLFLILSGKKNLPLFIILGICFAAHYGNMLLLGAMSVLCCWLSQSKNRKVTLLAVTVVYLAANIGVMLTNLNGSGSSQARSMGPYAVLAVKIMRVFPDLISSYADQYPGSPIAQERAYLEMASRKSTPVRDIFKRSAAAARDDEARRFLLFAAFRDPWRMAPLALQNTFDFLLFPGFDMALVRDPRAMRAVVGRFLPQQLPQTRGSLQERGKLRLISQRGFYKISYTLAMLTLAGYLFSVLLFPKAVPKRYFGFVLFAVIALLCNAAICSNLILTGDRLISGRHQTRILLVPYLAAALILADYANEYRKKFLLLMKRSPAPKKN